ncbi:MAG: L,D-transpeptidase family protein [Pseudomonadota bacterium]
MKRRNFLSGLAALGASAATTPAMAENPIASIIRSSKRDNWNDQFDARKGDAKLSSTNIPVFSPQTPVFVQRAIEEYRQLSLNGGWPVVPANKKLRLGNQSRNVQILRDRLIASRDLSPKTGRSDVFDTWVDGAVRRFQARHGLPADGVMGKFTFAAMNVPASIRLGQLETNLVRLRSMSGYLGDRYVMVNIPAAQIEAVRNGKVESRHTAIVGKTDRQSPIIASKIYELNLNPYWTSPVSIIKKDLIPLMQKDPTYLTRNNIRIFDWNTKEEIPPQSINWNSDEAVNYMFRQDPGKINAMGSVKINFPNPHAVYMHDTPQQSLFSKLLRFESSGCVRVQNVRDLIAWLADETPGWGRRQLERTIETGDRVDVTLAAPVPVYWNYITAWSTKNSVVQFRDDIYSRDGAQELASANWN